MWALFVFIICNMSLGSLAESRLFFKGFDKLTHCGLFFMLVVFYCHGFIKQQSAQALTYKKALTIVLVAIVYGGMIEILQLTIFTWRSGEWADWFVDTVGACMGIFGVMLTLNAANDVEK